MYVLRELMDIVSVDTHIPKVSVSQFIEVLDLFMKPNSVLHPLAHTGSGTKNRIAIH